MGTSSKKTKVVATVGPASSSPEKIAALLSSGVDVFRLNFSHGSHETHERAIRTIREECAKLGIHRAILADLQGPKIRTGKTAKDRLVRLSTGSRVTVSPVDSPCTESLISTDYPKLNRLVKPGQLIMINDGAIRLRVEKVEASGELRCDVVSGGTYSSHKGVNLPDVDLGIPSMTEKDRDDLNFVLEQDVQYVAMSFVKTRADLVTLNDAIQTKRHDIKTIAKIEKPEAARAIDEILHECDGIMVARGDLGVEASPWEVPILQKDLIEHANRAGKLVIVATQMLESMIQNPIPTRAESSDVANAIFDGADAIMLSGETAVGSFPAEAADMMRRIVEKAEGSRYSERDPVDLSLRGGYPAYSICEAAVWASHDMGDIPVCVLTLSGETALYMAKLRGRAPLYALTPDVQVACMLSLAWGVVPFLLPFADNIPELHTSAERVLEQAGYLKHGDSIVIVSGTTPVEGATNMLRIKAVGSSE